MSEATSTSTDRRAAVRIEIIIHYRDREAAMRAQRRLDALIERDTEAASTASTASVSKE